MQSKIVSGNGKDPHTIWISDDLINKLSAACFMNNHARVSFSEESVLYGMRIKKWLIDGETNKLEVN